MEHIVDEHGCAITIFKGVRGTMNRVDVQTIIDECKNCDKYVETGSYLGLSALIAASHSNALVYAHDIWETDWSLLKGGPPPKVDDYFLRFYDMVKNNNLCSRIIPIRGSSHYTIAIHDDETIDLALVDGDHSYEGCYTDLKMIFPKMKKDSVILVHDCYTNDSETTQAVMQFLRDNSSSIKDFKKILGSCGMLKIKINK